MNEQELLDLYISASELAVQTMMFYLTIITGYLVVAHFAGANLLKGQIIVVNMIFIVFSAFSMWGSIVYFNTASHFWQQTQTYQEFLDEELLTPGVLIGVLEFFGIVASLNYMRDIRSRARMMGATGED